MRISMWSVTVNGAGMFGPQKFYGLTREQCEDIAECYECSDDVRYAGQYDKAHAEQIMREQKEAMA